MQLWVASFKDTTFGFTPYLTFRQALEIYDKWENTERELHQLICSATDLCVVVPNYNALLHWMWYFAIRWHVISKFGACMCEFGVCQSHIIQCEKELRVLSFSTLTAINTLGKLLCFSVSCLFSLGQRIPNFDSLLSQALYPRPNCPWIILLTLINRDHSPSIGLSSMDEPLTAHMQPPL